MSTERTTAKTAGGSGAIYDDRFNTGTARNAVLFDFFFETNQPDAAEKDAIEFIDTVLQPEDIGLVESVQRGMRTPAFDQGRYLVDPEGSGLSEHAVHHFHSLILEAYQSACV